MISKFFKNNLSLKIISLIVAIILWFFAISELNPERTQNLSNIPVEIINMDQLNRKNLTLVEDPASMVTIRIKGLVNDIRRVNDGSLKAVLDLGDIDWTGTQNMELEIVGLPPREISLERVPEISVTINRIISKPIPVEIEVTGNGGDGYYVHEANAEPPSVTIYGAQSLVDSVVQGIVKVKLDQDEGTIKQSLPIELVDSVGNIVNGGSEKFIRPRITKSYEKQNNRTRNKAEVFTPSWVCNEQNNLIDEQWFGRKNVFNIAKDRDWIPNNEKIEFPNVKDKTWKDYVDARRMEITCGEAPYLVSRYDTVTGEVINLKSRIGLLDRKIRVVSENAKNEDEWIKWTVRAFQSVYGYEFQGDNLLLARENLLHTFIDNVRDKLKREPSLKELKRIATIISWNLWQMDGLTFAIPFSELREEYQQMSLFENLEDLKEKPEDKYCKIKIGVQI
jgi:hypothetical protein